MPQNRPPRRHPNRRPAAPGTGSRGPRAGGSRRPAPASAAAPSGFRGQLDAFSYPVLLRLTAAPKWLLGAGTAAILLGGLLAPSPWGPALLALVTLFLAWLLVLAWPRLQPGPRVARAGVVGALGALVVARAADWL